jgi:hypothetical protein
MNKKVARRAVLLGLAAGGGAFVAIGGTLRRRILQSHGVEPLRGPMTPHAVTAGKQGRTRAALKALPHVNRANNAAREGIEERLRAITAFFDEAKGHATAFADEVLGWYSKYKLIRGQHEEFLAETFRKHFFGPEELKRAMTNAVAGYVADLEVIDNRMLVDIRLDVGDLPAGVSLAVMPVPDLQERYRSVCRRIADITGADTAVDVGRAAVDMIVSSVVTMMATRLGTAAVVLGAGAASTWWTLGIGLVVGVIVDQIIAAAWNWTYDPHGKLVAMMGTKIDEVRNIVLNGDDGKPGLREQLRRYADKRAIVRREAVLELLAGTNGRN